MKVDITIGKKFTLNTQNFSSISPTLILTIKDEVDAKKILKAHKLLELIADGLFTKQIESDAKTMAVIKKMGFSDYFKNIDKDDMELAITNAVKELING